MSNLEQLATARTALHSSHSSQRILSDEHDKVGLAGEFAFSDFCGVDVDIVVRPGGDKGVDFIIPLNFTVDVKTYRKPYNLIHEVGKPSADIFVLAAYNGVDETASLLGWEFGKILEQKESRDFGYGIINYFIPVDELRNMNELRFRLNNKEKTA